MNIIELDNKFYFLKKRLNEYNNELNKKDNNIKKLTDEKFNKLIENFYDNSKNKKQ